MQTEERGAPETWVHLRGEGTVRRVCPIPPGGVKEGFPAQVALEPCGKEPVLHPLALTASPGMEAARLWS